MKKRNCSNSKLIIMFYLFLAIYVHVGLRLSCIPGSDKSAFVAYMCYYDSYVMEIL